MFLLATEMAVALRGWANLNTTVCCPWLLIPREKGLQSVLWHAALLGLKTKPASSFYSTQMLSSVLGNATVGGTWLWPHSSYMEWKSGTFSILSFWGLPTDPWPIVSPARHSLLPSWGLSGLWQMSGVSSTVFGMQCHPDPAHSPWSPGYCLHLTWHQWLLASQKIQAGWVWPRVLKAE